MAGKVKLHMTGKPINYADVIKDRAMHIGRPRIALGKKHKIFKSPFRMERGIKL